MYNILIVEDDNRITNSIIDYLGSRNHLFMTAENGITGYRLARDRNFDLVILDINLPKRNGLLILNMLRNEMIETPILILSGENETETICNAMSKGADGYLTKPFSMQELKARVDAMLRRPPLTRNLVSVSGAITIDHSTREIFVNGRQIDLRKKEFEILSYFTKNPDMVISRQQLLNNIWDRASEPFEGTVDVHISNIRRKLGKEHDPIRTVHGTGYMFASS